jgi:hypothetical protein
MKGFLLDAPSLRTSDKDGGCVLKTPFWVLAFQS